LHHDGYHGFSGLRMIHFLHKKGGDMKSREYIKAEENLKIDQEKRYQRKDKRAQVEGLTTIKKDKKAKEAKK
jgi:hypothetical protein